MPEIQLLWSVTFIIQRTDSSLLGILLSQSGGSRSSSFNADFKALLFWLKTMTHFPYTVIFVLFLTFIAIITVSAPVSWLLACLCHYLGQAVLGKSLSHMITAWPLATRGWAVVLSVIFPLLPSLGTLYILMSFLATMTCLFFRSKISPFEIIRLHFFLFFLICLFCFIPAWPWWGFLSMTITFVIIIIKCVLNISAASYIKNMKTTAKVKHSSGKGLGYSRQFVQPERHSAGRREVVA